MHCNLDFSNSHGDPFGNSDRADYCALDKKTEVIGPTNTTEIHDLPTHNLDTPALIHPPDAISDSIPDSALFNTTDTPLLDSTDYSLYSDHDMDATIDYILGDFNDISHQKNLHPHVNYLSFQLVKSHIKNNMVPASMASLTAQLLQAK